MLPFHQFAESSGIIRYSEALYEGACIITSLAVFADGTHQASIDIYDSVGQGIQTDFDHKFSSTVAAGNIGPSGRDLNTPVKMHRGIYVNLSGTGAYALVEYVPLSRVNQFDKIEKVLERIEGLIREKIMQGDDQ